MLWQSAYSEFYFCDAPWPAFRQVDFLRAARLPAAPAPLRALTPRHAFRLLPHEEGEPLSILELSTNGDAKGFLILM